MDGILGPLAGSKASELTRHARIWRVRIVDAVGTNRYTYTAWGALLSEDGPWADDTVTYAYTTNRLHSKLTLAEPNASDWVQTYAYDKANRLTNTASPAGAFGYRFRPVTFYDPVNGTPFTTAGRLVERLVLPSGAYITNVYDALARLTSTRSRTAVTCRSIRTTTS